MASVGCAFSSNFGHSALSLTDEGFHSLLQIASNWRAVFAEFADLSSNHPFRMSIALVIEVPGAEILPANPVWQQAHTLQPLAPLMEAIATQLLLATVRIDEENVPSMHLSLFLSPIDPQRWTFQLVDPQANGALEDTEQQRVTTLARYTILQSYPRLRFSAHNVGFLDNSLVWMLPLVAECGRDDTVRPFIKLAELKPAGKWPTRPNGQMVEPSDNQILEVCNVLVDHVVQAIRHLPWAVTIEEANGPQLRRRRQAPLASARPTAYFVPSSLFQRARTELILISNSLRSCTWLQKAKCMRPKAIETSGSAKQANKQASARANAENY